MKKLFFEAVFAENISGGVAGFKEGFANLLAVRAGNFEVFGLNFLAVVFAAIFATSRFVMKTFLVEKFLLTSGPEKLFAAVLTNEGFIGKFHA